MSGRTLLLFIQLILFCPIQAQIGIFALPNSSIEVANLNPAKVSVVNHEWELQLVSASLYGQTNHAYLRNESLLNLGKQFFNKEGLIPRIQSRFTSKLAYYDRDNSTFLKGHFRVTGPSFTIKAGHWHIGLISGINFSASGSAIPSSLGYYNNYSIPVGTEYDLQRGQGAGLLWSDLGIHLSRTWEIHRFKQISWGVNLKYLNSFYGFAAKNTGTSVARKLGGSRVAAVSGRGEVLLSDAWRYETPFGIHSTGNGIGIDVGMVMQSRSSIYAKPIEWGVSLSNLGLINLTKETTRRASINVQNEVEFSAASFEETAYHPQASFSTFNQLILSKGNEVEETPGSVFYTPAKINAYFSTPISKNVSSQLTWQQSLIWDYRTAVSMNYLALSATYQQNQFAVSLPVTFMNYQQIWTGLNMRLGPLTIGTDRLFGTFLPNQRLDGASFYIGLKLDNMSFPFRTAWWPKKSIQCPSF